MKVIIAGSRSIKRKEILLVAIQKSGFEITEIVSGGCRAFGGCPDELGEDYGFAKEIPIKIFPAKWKQYRLAAGPIRNRTMAKYADALIALWDGKSKGTKSMISEMKQAKKETYVLRVDENLSISEAVI